MGAVRSEYKYAWQEREELRTKDRKKPKPKSTPKKDIIFYDVIWKKRPHQCENCGKKISEPSTTNFHHLLEKADYPEYRYEEINIMILDNDCHYQYHNFPDKTPGIIERQKQVMEHFNI